MRLILGQWSDQCLVYNWWLQASFTEGEFASGENANCDFIPQRCETGINQHLKHFADTGCSQLLLRGPGVNRPEADSSKYVHCARTPLHSLISRGFKSIRSKRYSVSSCDQNLGRGRPLLYWSWYHLNIFYTQVLVMLPKRYPFQYLTFRKITIFFLQIPVFIWQNKPEFSKVHCCPNASRHTRTLPK